MRVGVEVGGTFTDLVAIGEDGIRVTKVPSVPAHPDEGAFAALVASGIDIPSIVDLAHGSTVATNAVLERKGGRVAFVTTAGFRDILAMQRHNRTRIYDLEYRKPEPVVRRADTFEVRERVAADGSIITPLDEAVVVAELVPRLTGGYEAVAVCLLNAYANPEHEERLARILGEHLPGLLVTVSSEVTREFREYERASTTTLSAYVQPVIDRYVGRFERRLAEAGFRGRFSVMQSNGGRLPAEGMRRNAITALLSGPAAGVMGATRQAGRSGFRNLITLDMGGTSTDVCLVADGHPALTTEFQIDGLPIRTPVLDINTVGAGGGSIVWIDEGGMLRAGPHSAGADPGPACYGRGGEAATITDAHLLCGTIRPEAFLGGRMRIDLDAAARAFEPVAQRLGMSTEAAAEAAIRVANANIVRAIQIVSTERGKDPRDYVMVPFGGAGPLQAARVADELAIRTIVVPPNAGVISAFGLIAADYVQFESLTRRAPLDDAAPGVVAGVYREMRERGLGRFADLGLAERVELTLTVDMRFVGQAFEVPVELDPRGVETLTTPRLRELFTEAHERIFFHGAGAEQAVEMVSFRLGLTSPLERVPVLSESHDGALAARDVDIYEGGRRRRARLSARSALVPGEHQAGPAVLVDATSTVLVPEGWTATVDPRDNLVLTAASRE
jgi:N-methylhydantoinase A